MEELEAFEAMKKVILLQIEWILFQDLKPYHMKGNFQKKKGCESLKWK
jgi:hypothetical protein